MADDAAGVTVWPVRPLQRVFPDDTAGQKGAAPPVRLLAAQNEYEAFQIAVTAGARPSRVEARLGPLHHQERGYVLPEESGRICAVGLVQARLSNTEGRWACPLEEIERPSPGLFPDPLVPEPLLAVPPGESRAFWATIYVPPDAPPGQYAGEVRLTGDGVDVAVPVALEVLPFRLPEPSHMWLTNWCMPPSSLAAFYRVERWSPEFWEIVDGIAADMAEHRQNVILTPLYQLISGTFDRDGTITYDYRHFDRWVETFLRHGIIRIEGGHVATKIVRDPADPNLYSAGDLLVTRADDGRLYQPLRYWFGGETFRRRIGDFLTQLRRHLLERGWLDRFIIHLADEPGPVQAPAYRELGAFVRTVLPEVPRIDALSCEDVAGAVDIWVPLLPKVSAFHRARQQQGEELWWYTCCNPRGDRYPNRFIDYPLIKTRIIHWLTYSNRIQGFLHWGYNFYGHHRLGGVLLDPWAEVEARDLPAGDPFVVYPGRGSARARPVSSQRWETIRDGMEDFEYLWLLGEACDRAAELARAAAPGPASTAARERLDEAAAQARRVLWRALEETCPSLEDYTRDPALLLRHRETIGRALARLTAMLEPELGRAL